MKGKEQTEMGKKHPCDHYAKNVFEEMYQATRHLLFVCGHDLEVLVNNEWLPVSASGNSDGLQQTSHKQTRLWFVLCWHLGACRG